jgi:hypothetical protein
MKRVLRGVQIIIFLLIGLLVIGGIQFFIQQHKLSVASDLRQEARNGLEVGMTREAAEEHLDIAKVHFQCGPENAEWDYYLFSEEIADFSAPLYLRYDYTESNGILTGIYSPEFYMIERELPTCDRLK